MTQKELKIAIIIADFYKHIATLQMEAIEEFAQKKNLQYDVFRVNGALEIAPLIAIKKNDFDVFVALGCVIRGETTHYEIVSEQSAHGIMTLCIHNQLCIGNGILTVENERQALERANKNKLNKAQEAFVAALQLYHYKTGYVLDE